jgi:hypothetical protein
MAAESERDGSEVELSFDVDDIITDLRTALEGKTYECIKMTATLRSMARERKRLLTRIKKIESQLPRDDDTQEDGSDAGSV